MERDQFDYSRLRGRIREVFGTQDRYANAIGRGPVSVSQRLNNQQDFDQTDMEASARVLGFGTEDIPAYFFVRKVQVTER